MSIEEVLNTDDKILDAFVVTIDEKGEVTYLQRGCTNKLGCAFVGLMQRQKDIEYFMKAAVLCFNTEEL